MVQKNLRKDLEELASSGVWKDLLSTGSTLYIYTLPSFAGKKEIFKISDSRNFIIGGHVISSNTQSLAFIVQPKNLAQLTREDTQLYVANIDGGALRNIPNVPGNALLAFLGNTTLLFGGCPNNNSQYLCTLDLETSEVRLLDELGPCTVGMFSAKTSSAGDLLVYEASEGFMLYQIFNRSKTTVKVKGSHPVLSPNGKQLLFKRGFSGSYYLVTINDGKGETLLLSEREIRSLLPDSGAYRDLEFISWSPDDRFILFRETSDRQKNKAFVVAVDTREIFKIPLN